MKKSTIKLILLNLLPFGAFAQEAGKGSLTYFANPLFDFLLAAIVLLLALIAILGSTLQNIAKSDYLAEKVRKIREKSNGAGNVSAVIFFLFMSTHAFGAEGTGATAVAAPKDNWLIGGLDYFTFYLMLGIIACEIAVVAILFFVMKNLLREEQEKIVAAPVAEAKPKEKTLLEKINASVEIEREEEIMLTHNYDGIRELDNNLPPWWKYGFYMTIVFAFLYMIHYHISKTGDLQMEEFNKEVAKGEAEVAAYLKNSANNVDETNVTALSDPADIAAGKEIFTGICSTCHGKAGEGTIGPNLTDDYWLHGGSVIDVFKTIKYGWPDKGMQSWKDTYSPKQIQQLASYIRSLRGTNPPNPKEKQGDLYMEGGAKDSTNLKVDSLKIVPPVDSVKKNIAEKK